MYILYLKIYILSRKYNFIYNRNMIIEAKEQIKSLLALRGYTLKKLAQMITEKTGQNCSPASLSNKFSRGTMSYHEVAMIAELLGFEISFNDVEKRI